MLMKQYYVMTSQCDVIKSHRYFIASHCDMNKVTKNDKFVDGSRDLFKA